MWRKIKALWYGIYQTMFQRCVRIDCRALFLSSIYWIL